MHMASPCTCRITRLTRPVPSRRVVCILRTRVARISRRVPRGIAAKGRVAEGSLRAHVVWEWAAAEEGVQEEE